MIILTQVSLSYCLWYLKSKIICCFIEMPTFTITTTFLEQVKFCSFHSDDKIITVAQ